MAESREEGNQSAGRAGRAWGFICAHKGILLITLVAVVFFAQTLSMRRAYYFDDIPNYYYPVRVFFSHSLKDGHLPLMCKNIFSGFPLFADTEGGLFYPVNFLSFFLPNLLAFSYLIFLNFLGSALFTYLYCRAIKLSKAAAVFAGLSFAFLGFSAAHLGAVNIQNTLPWFPLILYLVEKGLQKDSYSYFIWAGLALGVQFLAGFMMIPLLVLVIVFFYVVLYPREGRWKRRTLARAAGMFAVFAALGVALSMVQNLPAYHLANVSVRAGGLTKEMSNIYKYPVRNLVGLVFPHFYGTYSNYWGSWVFLTTFAYVGLLPLAFIPAAFFRKVSWHAKLFAVVGLSALVISFGDKGLVWDIIHKIPGFNVLKDPYRFLVVFDFALVIIGAIGLDRVLRREDFGRKRMTWLATGLSAVAGLIVGGIVLLKFIARSTTPGGTGWMASILEVFRDRVHLRDPAFYVPVILMAVALGLLWLWRDGVPRRSVFVVLLLAFVIFEVFYTGYTIFTTVPASQVRQTPQFVQAILDSEGSHRVSSLSRSLFLPFQPNTLLAFSSPGQTEIDLVPSIEGDVAGDFGGIEDAQGYSTLSPERYDAFLAAARKTKLQNAYDLLDVGYFVTYPTAVGNQGFDVTRPVRLGGSKRSMRWEVGLFEASKMNVLSTLSGGPPLPAGQPVASIYVQTDSGRVGPFLLKVGEQTDQAEYKAFTRQGKLARPPAQWVTYTPPGTQAPEGQFLGTVEFGGEFEVRGLEMELDPTLSGSAFTVAGMNLVGSTSSPAEIGPVEYVGEGAILYENPESIGPSMVVGGAVVAEDWRFSMGMLFEKGYDPERTLALERESLSEEMLEKVEGWGPDRTIEGRASTTIAGDDKIEISAEASDDCLLFVSQSYLPGWSAAVDGKPADVLPAYGALMAIPLPAGQHTVKLTYTPPGFIAGTIISLLALAAAIAGLTILWKRKRPGRGGPTNTRMMSSRRA